MLDPKTLTPEQLYKLQSETWAQGAEYERERITELLENFDDSNLWRQTGPDTYEGFDVAEIIELIKGEQK